MSFFYNKKQKYMENLSFNLSFKVKALLFANVLILADLLSKFWADDNLKEAPIVIIDKFFMVDGHKDWYGIWMAFAAYSLVVAILFAVMFKHKHNPKDIGEITH